MKNGINQFPLLYNPPLQNELPGWVRWLAQDADGQWWGYPNMKHDGWYENELGRHIKLNNSGRNPDWAASLTPVPPGATDNSA